MGERVCDEKRHYDALELKTFAELSKNVCLAYRIIISIAIYLYFSNTESSLNKTYRLRTKSCATDNFFL